LTFSGIRVRIIERQKKMRENNSFTSQKGCGA